MTRPTILDLDLVVVPREATMEMQVAGNFNHDQSTEAVFSAMLSASPYPTAWDDVRKYVEGLETDRNDAIDDARFAERIAAKREADAEARAAAAETRTSDLERLLFPYANNTEISGISWDGKYLIGDKASISEFHSLKNRGEQIDVYKRAYDQNLAAATSRAEAAEARIAELEERLADAERVIEPFAKVKTADGYPDGFLRIPDEHGMLFNATDALGETTNWEPVVSIGHLRAARAYMEEK